MDKYQAQDESAEVPKRDCSGLCPCKKNPRTSSYDVEGECSGCGDASHPGKCNPTDAEMGEQECPCGSIIVQTRPGGPWIDQTAKVFGELCYPDAEGADGEAVHEPLGPLDGVG